jgi:xylan 1,4-beta-xylosidase
MGPWLANNIRQCDGLTDTMAYWTFSDVFEEQGVAKTPFYGGFGLIAVGGIPKASFNAFQLLHQLGTERIPSDSPSVIATRRPDGGLVLALWNYAPPGQQGGSRDLRVQFTGVSGNRRMLIHRLDANHGSALTAWRAMGSPSFPTREQQRDLRRSAQLAAPEQRMFDAGKESGTTVTLPSQGLVLIELLNR